MILFLIFYFISILSINVLINNSFFEFAVAFVLRREKKGKNTYFAMACCYYIAFYTYMAYVTIFIQDRGRQ